MRRTGGHLAAKLASGAPAVPAAGAHHAALNTRPRCHALPADGPHSGCTASASACARRWAAARSDSRAARAGSPKRTNSASASSCIRAARKCAANALSHAKRTRSENIVQTKLPRPRATEQPHEHELTPQIPCLNVVTGLVGGRCRGQGGGVSTPASRSGSRQPPTRGGGLVPHGATKMRLTEPLTSSCRSTHRESPPLRRRVSPPRCCVERRPFWARPRCCGWRSVWLTLERSKGRGPCSTS